MPRHPDQTPEALAARRDLRLRQEHAQAALLQEFPKGKPFSSRFWAWHDSQSPAQTAAQILAFWDLSTWPQDDVDGLHAAITRARRYLTLKGTTENG